MRATYPDGRRVENTTWPIRPVDEIYNACILNLYRRLTCEASRASGERRGLRVHGSLGGQESALTTLGSCAAPELRLSSSRPGDPIKNIGVGLRVKLLISCKLGCVLPFFPRRAVIMF